MFQKMAGGAAPQIPWFLAEAPGGAKPSPLTGLAGGLPPPDPRFFRFPLTTRAPPGRPAERPAGRPAEVQRPAGRPLISMFFHQVAGTSFQRGIF